MDLLYKMAAVAAIVCAIPIIRKYYKYLNRKIKSSRVPVYLRRTKQYFVDIYQRLFQPHIESEPKSSVEDYINSPHALGLNFNPPVTLPITSNGQTKIYPGVTRIEINPINPFLANSGALLSIEYNKEGYSMFTSLDAISHDDNLRLRRQMYFLKILENERKQSDST